MRAVVLAALTEGVPDMLDMIPAQSAFVRRRREATFLCAQTLRQNARRRAAARRVSIARRLDSDDAEQMVTLVTMC